jgi:hypothetical protein
VIGDAADLLDDDRASSGVAPRDVEHDPLFSPSTVACRRVGGDPRGVPA